ncbi:C39 family peptidase [Candidatus Saccharibacteria bacterium]|nr:C39 family peptidase [Candidatus Saccharibacteria bacterium]
MGRIKNSRLAMTILVAIISLVIISFVVCSSILIRHFSYKRAQELANAPKPVTVIDKVIEKVGQASDYINWNKTADSFLDENGVLKESVSEQDVADLSRKMNELESSFKELVTEKMNQIRTSYDKIVDVKNLVTSLFTTEDRSTVRPDIVRNDYDIVRAQIDELKQENLKAELIAEIDRTLPVIEEKERIAREKAEAERRAREEEQRKIAAAWTRLNLSPYYINQFSYEYWNGCEAASLLMALKYKGYSGQDYVSFANSITQTDNPNTGFYLSMKEPRNGGPAHWIAPAPLATYGKGHAVNVSGYSLDQLDAEVKNGNPVIIYLTYRYANPSTYHNGVPDNLHVVVLAGYNSYTGQQVFYDPAPVSGTIVTLSKSRTEYLYNASGRRALIIK